MFSRADLFCTAETAPIIASFCQLALNRRHTHHWVNNGVTIQSLSSLSDGSKSNSHCNVARNANDVRVGTLRREILTLHKTFL